MNDLIRDVGSWIFIAVNLTIAVICARFAIGNHLKKKARKNHGEQ
jgi:hypothetical protein